MIQLRYWVLIVPTIFTMHVMQPSQEYEQFVEKSDAAIEKLEFYVRRYGIYSAIESEIATVKAISSKNPQFNEMDRARRMSARRRLLGIAEAIKIVAQVEMQINEGLGEQKILLERLERACINKRCIKKLFFAKDGKKPVKS